MAADKGNIVAINTLGSLYENGNGVPQDYGEAMAWYRKAADQGSVTAMVGIGSLYANGRGVNKDDSQARLWYQKAANAGDEGAKKALSQSGGK